MSNNYQKALTSVQRIERLSYQLESIATSMVIVGLKDGGDSVSRIAYGMRDEAERAKKAISGGMADGMADQYEQAQQASANMLKAALAAAKLERDESE